MSRPVLRPFLVALHGLADLVRNERHAQIHLICSLALVPVGLWLRLERRDWAVLVLAMGLVWTAEALNTAVERLADAVHPEHHPLVGRAKDVAAAGVLLAALTAAFLGLLILGPPLWLRIFPV